MGICWVFMSRPKTFFENHLKVNRIATSVTRQNGQILQLGIVEREISVLFHGSEALHNKREESH